ncbi:MAG TPA: efflux RND transporter periplasmic adaptor subunit [Ramlibacter sp.]|nr:efflux RND transporter periplasmic adaptor subunit [Ramlibacter sp.]
MAAALAATVSLAATTIDDANAAAALPLATAVASSGADNAQAAYDGVVEAVRQTVIAAQVSGAVTALGVKAGDRVHAGQVLLRLDARAARQTAAAATAQVRAAQASRHAATREFERQKQLFEKNYSSRAALDRAEARYKSAQAEVSAQLASAGAAGTQSDFYVVRAPYSGIVASVDVVLGDMAMPGRPLLSVYDPAALRVTAAIPQSAVVLIATDAMPQAEVPGRTGRLQPLAVQLLPTVDPATHTQALRLELPRQTQGITPGAFARVWLPLAASGQKRVFVPAAAVFRRAELTGVYVVGDDGRPLLRQVRLGASEGDRVEILSGVAAGERVALDPQAAARVR